MACPVTKPVLNKRRRRRKSPSKDASPNNDGPGADEEVRDFGHWMTPSTPSGIDESTPIVVLDLDHTLVGDLSPFADRDNIEKSLSWTWPEGVVPGVPQEEIVQGLLKGLMRPGVPELAKALKDLGAYVAVYTHSETIWAKRVLQALEEAVGFPFVSRLFTRADCRDAHPEFKSKKCLLFILRSLGLPDDRASLNRVVMVEDDPEAVPEGPQRQRMVVVAPYNFYVPCSFDTTLTTEFLAIQRPEVVLLARSTVLSWGLAPPYWAKRKLSPTEAQEVQAWRHAWGRWEAIREKRNLTLTSDCLLHQAAAAVTDAGSALGVGNWPQLLQKVFSSDSAAVVVEATPPPPGDVSPATAPSSPQRLGSSRRYNNGIRVRLTPQRCLAPSA